METGWKTAITLTWGIVALLYCIAAKVVAASAGSIITAQQWFNPIFDTMKMIEWSLGVLSDTSILAPLWERILAGDHLGVLRALPSAIADPEDIVDAVAATVIKIIFSIALYKAGARASSYFGVTKTHVPGILHTFSPCIHASPRVESEPLGRLCSRCVRLSRRVQFSSPCTAC